MPFSLKNLDYENIKDGVVKNIIPVLFALIAGILPNLLAIFVDVLFYNSNFLPSLKENSKHGEAFILSAAFIGNIVFIITFDHGFRANLKFRWLITILFLITGLITLFGIIGIKILKDISPDSNLFMLSIYTMLFGFFLNIFANYMHNLRAKDSTEVLKQQTTDFTQKSPF